MLRDLEKRPAGPVATTAGYRIVNRPRRVQVEFSGGQVELMRYTPEGRVPFLTWRLQSVGRTDASAPALSVPPRAEGTRVVYDRGTLQEWYESRPDGLEQGFTLPDRLPGTGSVVIQGSIHTERLRPRAAPGGELQFVNSSDVPELRYFGLRAEDARGRELPARMEFDQGTVRLVLDDAGARYPVVVDPLFYVEPIWSHTGDQDFAHYGVSVATAGDVNGDGYSDVIVGASELGESFLEGRVFVYLGSASGLSDAPAWSAQPDTAAQFGYSVSTAGDVNRDGFNDILIGAFIFADSGRTAAGRVYAWYGGSTGLGPDGTNANADWIANGPQPNSWLGLSVSAAGDVNGDGYDDIVVGAPRFSNGETMEGAAFVWHGGSNGLGAKFRLPDWRAEGQMPMAEFGASVSGAGDVNGDGFADILVGARGYDSSALQGGSAFLWLGGAGGLGPDGDPANADWAASSSPDSAAFGYSVTGIGDTNGDGFSDVCIGAPDAPNGGTATVLLGRESTPYLQSSIVIPRPELNTDFGRCVARAGDTNGDGFADLIVSDPEMAYGTVPSSGAVYLFESSAAGLRTTPTEIIVWEVEGTHAFGSSAAVAGDVDGDGFSDLIVGAHTSSFDQSNEGFAIALRGTGDMPARVESDSMLGVPLFNGLLGRSLTSAGDVNGDGFSDVLVGSPEYSYVAPQNGEGVLYLYFGSENGLGPFLSASGDSARRGLGYSACAADVNGDGLDDVIAGTGVGGGAGSPPRAGFFIWYGDSTGMPGWGSGYSAAAIPSADQAYYFPRSSVYRVNLAEAGDLNADGYGDVLVGLDGPATSAAIYLGGPSGLGSTPAWSLAGIGATVASAGDVNGDGRTDALIGNPASDVVRLYLSDSTSTPNHISDAVFLGTAGSQYGYSIASCGDIDADGYSDIVIGAPSLSPRGAVYVYRGSPTGAKPSTLAWSFASVFAGYGFGVSVAGAGDVNGDGLSDVMVGAPYEAPGWAYVFPALGAPGYFDPYGFIWALPGLPNGGRYGLTVAGAGDTNGDGFSDIVVGDDAYHAPYAGSGAAFLYWGNGGNGAMRNPRQFRANGEAPISEFGMTDLQTRIRIRMRGRSPAGRDRVGMEYVISPLPGSPDVESAGMTPLADTGAPISGLGSFRSYDEIVPALSLRAFSPFRWKARTISRSPYFPRSPWFSPPFNSRTEMDFRTAGTVSTSEVKPTVPPAKRLWSIEPNPFNPRTRIRLVLGRPEATRLTIHGADGRLIARLADGILGTGPHTFTWDGTNSGGQPVASGVYLVRAEFTQGVETKKVVLAR